MPYLNYTLQFSIKLECIFFLLFGVLMQQQLLYFPLGFNTSFFFIFYESNPFRVFANTFNSIF